MNWDYQKLVSGDINLLNKMIMIHKDFILCSTQIWIQNHQSHQEKIRENKEKQINKQTQTKGNK